MKKERLLYGFRILAVLIMTVQILCGFLWMAVNLYQIPVFGDSTEYYNLSQTLQVDEYRPILYPLIIRASETLCAHLPFPYQTLLYFWQTGISFLSILYLIWAWNHCFPKSKKKESEILRDRIGFHQSVYHVYTNDHLHEFFSAHRFFRHLHAAFFRWGNDKYF